MLIANNHNHGPGDLRDSVNFSVSSRLMGKAIALNNIGSKIQQISSAQGSSLRLDCHWVHTAHRTADTASPVTGSIDARCRINIYVDPHVDNAKLKDKK